MTARDKRFDQRPVFVFIYDSAVIGLCLDDFRQQHPAGFFADRQERAVGFPPRFTQGRLDNAGDPVVQPQDIQQRFVEHAGFVTIGRAFEVVIEAEPVEKSLKTGIIVMPEAFMRAERIGHAGQRLAQMFGHHFLLGHVFRHLAQTVHIVGERKQFGGNIGHRFECAPHHGGTHDLAKGADMRQAGRPIAGLEQHVTLFGHLAGGTFQKTARLGKRPRLGVRAERFQIGQVPDPPGVSERRKLRLYRFGVNQMRRTAQTDAVTG